MATKNIVPRATGEGTIGTSLKNWLKGFFNGLDVNGNLNVTGTATGVTPTAGDNSTKFATTAFVQSEVSNLVNSAPAALDTLNELAVALGDDPNFATTTATALGNKVDKTSADYIKSASVSGKTLTLTKGNDDTVTFTEVDTQYTGSDGVTLTGTNFTNSGVRAVATGTTSGTVSINTNGISADVAVNGWADKAALASPAFTGTPTAPTPTSSDNSTNVATTAFVENSFFGKLATHLAASTATTISSLDSNSLFYRMLSWALSAAGVQYNLSNSSAWYICLGSLFGGLIIQGGSTSDSLISNGVYKVTFPVAFSTFRYSVPVIYDTCTNWFAKHQISADLSTDNQGNQRNWLTELYLGKQNSQSGTMPGEGSCIWVVFGI